MKRIYFIRHGESVLNAQGLWAGSTDTPLTVIGQEQARLVAQELVQHDIDLIVSSPLMRALDTAKIVAEHLEYPHHKIMIHTDLRERHFGELEATLWTPDFQNKDIDHIKDVEKLDDFIARLERIYNLILNHDAQNILIVSHGAVSRPLRNIAAGLPYHHPQEKMKNAEVVRLK